MVLMLWHCAVRPHTHLSHSLAYCLLLHIVIVKCAWDCLSYLNVLKSVSLVVVRCGFLFLGLSLLSDALDINIIVQQWPRRVIHLCTLSSGLQTCLSAQCCRCLACSSSTASTIQHAFTGHEADMGFKSKSYILYRLFKMTFKCEWVVQLMVKPFLTCFCVKWFSFVCLFLRVEIL